MKSGRAHPFYPLSGGDLAEHGQVIQDRDVGGVVQLVVVRRCPEVELSRRMGCSVEAGSRQRRRERSGVRGLSSHRGRTQRRMPSRQEDGGEENGGDPALEGDHSEGWKGRRRKLIPSCGASGDYMAMQDGNGQQKGRDDAGAYGQP